MKKNSLLNNIKLLFLIKSVSTIPDECMGVGLEIGTSSVIGNEALENRSGRLFERIEDIVSATGDSGITCVEH